MITFARPAEGTRVRLRRDVERYPHFIAEAGRTGTVTIVEPNLIAVRMDAPLPGAEAWDNEVHWFDDHVPEFGLDCELLSRG